MKTLLQKFNLAKLQHSVCLWKALDHQMSLFTCLVMSSLFAGHHSHFPSPGIPGLHSVPGGVQGLYLRPQLPRWFHLQGGWPMKSAPNGKIFEMAYVCSGVVSPIT